MDDEGEPSGGFFAMCFGKQGFDSANVAFRVMRRRNASGTKGVCEPYRCPHCNRWHLGSSTKAHRKARRKRLTEKR